ncbi:hypothetical protein M2360_000084 [Rhizobium sp. SG_E_25_P2]|uniref:hypothetical protein n=1 Tax=Rhizobium sp. SG_E_25_P2 TaxID=2879942 RepID=UPI00247715EA|nr:hypothetical protein [Rhizobium sp. SG_E_25_P2]MDH6264703.1 hypothetical protein [Rhizobium sp. SG_E_25_P2]
MATLSLIIPVETRDESPAELLLSLAENLKADLEILLAAPDRQTADALDLDQLIVQDSRARIFIPASPPTSSLSLWSSAIEASKGAWISVVKPKDGFEPEAGRIADAVKAKIGKVDALAWNAIPISADADPTREESVGLPTGFDPFPYEKTNLLKAFFLWEGSLATPKAPFGLYHGILSRELANNIASTIKAAGRDHDLPQWEWAARVMLIGENFVFCPRPLSIVDQRPYAPPARYVQRADFPIHAGLGVTGGIIEIQSALFAEMGAAWTGAPEHVIRAILIDCVGETDPARFGAKCYGYRQALAAWEGGRHAHLFQPTFTGPRPLERRRGLHGTTLMVDRHIGGARNAIEFYRVIRNFLAPIGLMCGGVAV